MAGEPNRGDTATGILRAAKDALVDGGYAALSTRAIAEQAGVPLSQIHYHFGSKQNLMLAVLRAENAKLLDRQKEMFESDLPLWKQWEQACDFLDDDMESGYVRVLHEMSSAGWADPVIAQTVLDQLNGWHDLLSRVVRRAGSRLGGFGPFTTDELVVLIGASFVGVEAYLLLGVDEKLFPARSALRKVGEVIRKMEEG